MGMFELQRTQKIIIKKINNRIMKKQEHKHKHSEYCNLCMFNETGDFEWLKKSDETDEEFNKRIKIKFKKLKKVISDKMKLIETAQSFLDYFDEDNEKMTDEIYLWMDKNKIDHRTITYLNQLIMGDKNNLMSIYD